LKTVPRNHVTEWTFESGRTYTDPFNDVTVDVVFTGPDGRDRVAPAFWAGDLAWSVRFAASEPAVYRYRTVCSDSGNADLHGRKGAVEVTPCDGESSLLAHGRLRVAAGRRHLEHVDGAPFLWLGDTWWMGFCRRLAWPDGFRELVADRVAKGFSVIQIVAGLLPDMEPFDPRGANEAGLAWEPEYARINPAYFDMVDLRVAHMVRSGLAPCLVGSWGYYLSLAGRRVLERHWRYLIARYAAYPVIWCAAGEALMSYYLDRPKDEEEAEARRTRLRAAWSDIVRHIRGLDPFGNPVTIHPTRLGHDQVDDPSLLDLDMLQTGHGGHRSLSHTIDFLSASLEHEPRMPVLVGEANYEGIIESGREEMQRFMFWSCMLSGACGHTYGANGLWQVNERGRPYGPSPHGTAWGNLPWEDAYRLPGSGQIGLGKRLLERYPWWQFRPRPDWVRPHQTAGDRLSCYAAGIPRRVRMIYIPAHLSWTAWRGELAVTALEEGVAYRAFYFDPKTGAEVEFGTITGDGSGEWAAPKPPVFQDYVLVLDRP